MKMANELFNITLKCDFRRSTHAHSPSQLKKNESKNVDTSATKWNLLGLGTGGDNQNRSQSKRKG